MPLGHHVCLKPRDGAPLIDGPLTSRVLARVVLAKSVPFELLAVGAPVNHLHIETAEDYATSAELARRVALSLGRRLPVVHGFVPAYIEPIRHAGHLANLFAYVLRQGQRHNVALDPLREATSLPDLLGLRVIDRAFADRVRRALPRVTRAQLLQLLDVPTLEPQDATIEETIEAALAATALPNVTGLGVESFRLRAALAAVLGDRFPASHTAPFLGVSPQTVRRLRKRQPDHHLIHAIRLQTSLWARKITERRRATGPFDPKGPFKNKSSK